MEKEVVLCKDCVYNDCPQLCPMKEGWEKRDRDTAFCYMGEKKRTRKYKMGDLFKGTSVYGESYFSPNHLLIVGYGNEDESTQFNDFVYYCVQTKATDTIRIIEKNLDLAFTHIGRFPYTHQEGV